MTTSKDMPPATGGRQLRGIEKMAAIRDAAIQLLLSEGMKAVSHRRVATLATVPTSSVRYYFSSRDELIEACFTHLEERRAAAAQHIIMQKASEGHDGSTPKLANLLIRTMWGPEVSDASLLGAVGSALDAARENDTISQHFRSQRHALDADLAAVLEAWRRDDVSPNLVAAMINGSIINSAAEGHSDVLDRAVHDIVDLLDGGRGNTP